MLLCFNISDRKTFEGISTRYLEHFQSMQDKSTFFLLVVGTSKISKDNKEPSVEGKRKREVSYEEGLTLAKEGFNGIYLETEVEDS